MVTLFNINGLVIILQGTLDWNSNHFPAWARLLGIIPWLGGCLLAP